MKVLMLHKFYYVEGGAERYVFNITDLLKQKGHTVIPFAMQDDRNFKSEYSRYFASRFGPDQLFEKKNLFQRLQIARRVIFNPEAQRQLEALIEATGPDIAHVHSVYHHLSPSVLFTLKKYKLPVMMTLHDYKLVCPSYTLLNGKRQLCEACHGKSFWKATVKQCFRHSYAAGVLVTAEAYYNYWRRSYLDNVDLFVSPSKFLADKVSQFGYRHKPVRVQPLALDLESYEPCSEPSDYFVFMGRLTHEKGLNFLLDACQYVHGARLIILGTGPLENDLRRRIEREGLTRVTMLGYKSGNELKAIARKARFTVVPSEWHDNSPLVIYESLALGNPVIGAKMGGIPELIEEGVDGFTYELGDIKDFVRYVNYLIQNPRKAVEMGKNGRVKAEALFGFEAHYHKLLEFYNETRMMASC